MFFVEIVEQIGKPPLRIPASQAVIRLADGTPISMAAMFGSERSVIVSHCEDNNFQQNLQKIGITDTVIVEKMKV